MHKRHQPKGDGGPNCFDCTIAVDDLDSVARAVEANGGRITMTRAPIPTVGVLIRFEDPEGNMVAAMQYETPPRGSCCMLNIVPLTTESGVTKEHFFCPTSVAAGEQLPSSGVFLTPGA